MEQKWRCQRPDSPHISMTRNARLIGFSFSDCDVQHAGGAVCNAEVYEGPGRESENGASNHESGRSHMGSISTRSFHRSVCLSNGTLKIMNEYRLR